RLVTALIERKLPSFTLIGSGDVARGILATNAPQTDWQRLARKNALNLQAVLLGENARDQPVLFHNKRELTINMETARQIGVSLPFTVTAEAVLLNQDRAGESRTLTLKQAIEAGLRQNFNILANRITLAESDEDVKQARARWLPQLSAEISHSRLSGDNPGVSSNIAAERATDGALTLRQIIYSPDVAGNLTIQQALRDATAEDFRQLELDIINEISTAYFNLLKAENSVRLQRGYVLQNRENLSLARDRVRAGSAATSDEYRWVSELANARRTLLGVEAGRNRARDALNVLLNLPLDTPLQLDDVSLQDPELLISNQRIIDSVDNPRAFWQMGDFMIETGMEKSPELKQLSARIRAIEAELDLNRKSGVIPDIALQVSQNHRLSDSRAAPFSSEGEDDWSAGISLTLPLFEGGGRKARVSRGRLEARRLRTEYERLRQTIERNIRSSLHAIRASYPSIRLSRAAAEAARKTLEQVGDSYSKGTENIITLLDAQTSHLAAEQSALDAEYNFLIDLMNLQRSYGQFDYFLDEPERTSFSEALLQRLK
ncbi:MAG: TolC family protein, partial [Gammaproteobacteria bacterium]